MGKNRKAKKSLKQARTRIIERNIDLLCSYLGEKQVSGQEFTEVEEHLLLNFYKLDNRLFGPSRISVVLHTLAAIVLPTVLLAFLGLVFLGGKHYIVPVIDRAYEMVHFDAQVKPKENPWLDFVPEELNPKLQGKEGTLTLTFRPFKNRKDDLNYRTSLIKFITGIITVYRSSIKNPGEIARLIVEVSIEEEVNPLYIAAVVSTESAFSTYARSHVGALGLMQLMPRTAQEVSEKVTGNKSTPALTDPKTNLKLGITYLKELEKRYKNNRYNALCGYNWGPSNVDRVLRGRSVTPRSVSKYARTILERTLRWQHHYDSAIENSAEAEEALTKKTPV